MKSFHDFETADDLNRLYKELKKDGNMYEFRVVSPGIVRAKFLDTEASGFIDYSNYKEAGLIGKDHKDLLNCIIAMNDNKLPINHALSANREAMALLKAPDNIVRDLIHSVVEHYYWNHCAPGVQPSHFKVIIEERLSSPKQNSSMAARLEYKTQSPAIDYSKLVSVTKK